MMCGGGGLIDEHAGLIMWHFALANHPWFPCKTSSLRGCQVAPLGRGMQDFRRGGSVKGDGPEYWCWGHHLPFSCGGSRRVPPWPNARQRGMTRAVLCSASRLMGGAGGTVRPPARAIRVVSRVGPQECSKVPERRTGQGRGDSDVPGRGSWAWKRGM
jgi:hypothetical protein